MSDSFAHQAPLSLEFSRQEYWSKLPFPFPGDLPNPEIKPTSPALAGRFFTTEPPGKLPELPTCVDVCTDEKAMMGKTAGSDNQLYEQSLHLFFTIYKRKASINEY